MSQLVKTDLKNVAQGISEKAFDAELKHLGVADPRILDVYCGDGSMWEKDYGRTTNYLGIDNRSVETHGREVFFSPLIP